MVSMEEPVGLSLDHVAGRLYWISEYKEVGMQGSRVLPSQVLGSDEVGVGRVALVPLWLQPRHGREHGAVPRSGHASLGWEREGTTVSPVAVGQCQGVGVPHGHYALPCPQSIETLQVDGSGRHSFPAVLRSHTEPLGLAVFESWFFWTDGTELVSASRVSPQEHAVLLRAPVSAFTVLHALQQPPRK